MQYVFAHETHIKNISNCKNGIIINASEASIHKSKKKKKMFNEKESYITWSINLTWLTITSLFFFSSWLCASIALLPFIVFHRSPSYPFWWYGCTCDCMDTGFSITFHIIANMILILTAQFFSYISRIYCHSFILIYSIVKINM